MLIAFKGEENRLLISPYHHAYASLGANAALATSTRSFLYPPTCPINFSNLLTAIRVATNHSKDGGLIFFSVPEHHRNLSSHPDTNEAYDALKGLSTVMLLAVRLHQRCEKNVKGEIILRNGFGTSETDGLIASVKQTSDGNGSKKCQQWPTGKCVNRTTRNEGCMNWWSNLGIRH